MKHIIVSELTDQIRGCGRAAGVPRSVVSCTGVTGFIVCRH